MQNSLSRSTQIWECATGFAIREAASTINTIKFSAVWNAVNTYWKVSPLPLQGQIHATRRWAESELRVLSTQCLDRRIPGKQTLIIEIATREDDRNVNYAAW